MQRGQHMTCLVSLVAPSYGTVSFCNAYRLEIPTDSEHQKIGRKALTMRMQMEETETSPSTLRRVPTLARHRLHQRRNLYCGEV
jgi:hypothetical protein